jgi:hypothetical protein|tara:strand:- start:1163 stop:1369 length:207 start_codon:yes stop_codon:yes gene_type:complete
MFEDIEITTRKFQEFLKIEQERQLAMQELSQILGYDVTFSKEEMIRNAKESFAKYVSKEVSLLMKSAF